MQHIFFIHKNVLFFLSEDRMKKIHIYYTLENIQYSKESVGTEYCVFLNLFFHFT